jgi:hypothetical protein
LGAGAGPGCGMRKEEGGRSLGYGCGQTGCRGGGFRGSAVVDGRAEPIPRTRLQDPNPAAPRPAPAGLS